MKPNDDKNVSRNGWGKSLEFIGGVLLFLLAPFLFLTTWIFKISDVAIEHGGVIFKILFWFLIWGAIVIFLSQQFIPETITLEFKRRWIFVGILIVFFWSYGKYARFEWREHISWWLKANKEAERYAEESEKLKKEHELPFKCKSDTDGDEIK